MITLTKVEEEIIACYPLMFQLRPYLVDQEKFVKQVQRQMHEGYQLAYIALEGQIKALMGFRYLEFLAYGKMLYIDDLVTDAETRRNGLAGKLLKWAIQQAVENGCDQVHLDSGFVRHDAHRLYLNHRFQLKGHHFALDLKESINRSSL